jgi:type IV pilus assembly protein PilM
MLLGKKNHLIGLDIGSRTIKAAEIVDAKKGHVLKSFGVTEIPPGLIEEGAIKNPEQVSEAIRRLVSSYKMKEQNVALSIGGYSVIVKKINVQKMTEEQLQETIHLEAEQYIPFDINDVNLDFQMLGPNDGNPNLISVLLIAAKKEMVNDYANLVQMAGLNPCIIDVDAFALQNAYEFNYPIQNENVALIDIGAGKTSLNILKGDQSLFMRDVSLGCGQINQKIVSLANCTIEEAEQIKRSDQSEVISTEDLREIVSSVVSGWCTEIRRAFDFFYSTFPDDQVNRIILSGGGANIKEFRELLAVETSANVEMINPFRSFTLDQGRYDSAYLEQIAPQAAIAIGLGLRRVDDK